jgi:hypothetical protein
MAERNELLAYLLDQLAPLGDARGRGALGWRIPPPLVGGGSGGGVSRRQARMTLATSSEVRHVVAETATTRRGSMSLARCRAQTPPPPPAHKGRGN